MGEVVQLQGDQRKDVQDFLTDKKEGLGLDAKTIKVSCAGGVVLLKDILADSGIGPRFLVFFPDDCKSRPSLINPPCAVRGYGDLAQFAYEVMTCVCLYIVYAERLDDVGE